MVSPLRTRAPVGSRLVKDHPHLTPLIKAAANNRSPGTSSINLARVRRAATRVVDAARPSPPATPTRKSEPLHLLPAHTLCPQRKVSITVRSTHREGSHLLPRSGRTSANTSRYCSGTGVDGDRYRPSGLLVDGRASLASAQGVAQRQALPAQRPQPGDVRMAPAGHRVQSQEPPRGVEVCNSPAPPPGRFRHFHHCVHTTRHLTGSLTQFTVPRTKIMRQPLKERELVSCF